MTGEQLKLYLENEKVVKNQLALAMGVSKQVLYHYLTCANVSTNVLEAIAKGLNTAPENLYAEMREKGYLD